MSGAAGVEQVGGAGTEAGENGDEGPVDTCGAGMSSSVDGPR